MAAARGSALLTMICSSRAVRASSGRRGAIPAHGSRPASKRDPIRSNIFSVVARKARRRWRIGSRAGSRWIAAATGGSNHRRSEEHTSELQSLMRISYAVFSLKKKKKTNNKITNYMNKMYNPNNIHLDQYVIVQNNTDSITLPES